MGGLGSGRKKSESAMRLVEAQLFIKSQCVRDVRLRGGTDEVSIPIQRDKEVLQWIMGRVEAASPSHLIVSFGFRPGQGGRVWFAAGARSTRCNFGGMRWWFECNQCAGLVQKLYLIDDMCRCQRCCKLVHRSTRHSHDAERYVNFLEGLHGAKSTALEDAE